VQQHPAADVAVIYGRVSTVIQTQQGTSLPGQMQTGAGWAASKGLRVLERLSDDGVSGKRYWTRPAIQAALTLIEQQKARYLIFETVDRAARRGRIAIQIWERAWAADGVIVANGIEFDNSPNSKLIAAIFFGLAEWDYDNTLRKLTEGRKKTALGLDPSAPWRQQMQRGTPPYGLVVPKDLDILTGAYPKQLLGRHVIIEGDEEQAERLETVRTLFQMYYEGARIHHLSRWLAKQGIKSPRGCPGWTSPTLDYMLKNEVYKGYGQIYKTTGRFDEQREIERGINADYRIPTDPSERVDLLPVVVWNRETGEIRDAPPIVAPDIWQAVYDKRIRDEQENEGHGKLHYYLAAFGRCPICGAHWSGMTIKSKYGDWRYYRCAGKYVGTAFRKGCSANEFPYLKLEVVEKTVLDVLEAVMRDPTQIEQAIAAYEQQVYGNDKLALGRDRMLAEQRKLQQKLDGVTHDFYETDESETEARASLKRLVDKYRAELKDIRPRLEAIQRQIIPVDTSSPRTRAEKLSAAIRDVREALSAGLDDGVNADEKAFILGKIVERLDIDEEGRLVVTFKNLSHIPDLGIRIVGANVRERDKRTKFTDEQKARVLALAAEPGADVRRICRENKVGITTFYRWKKEAQAEPLCSTSLNSVSSDTFRPCQ
jgi:DNA invertase Pin-like site-specific DNA recombinase